MIFANRTPRHRGWKYASIAGVMLGITLMTSISHAQTNTGDTTNLTPIQDYLTWDDQVNIVTKDATTYMTKNNIPGPITIATRFIADQTVLFRGATNSGTAVVYCRQVNLLAPNELKELEPADCTSLTDNWHQEGIIPG